MRSVMNRADTRTYAILNSATKHVLRSHEDSWFHWEARRLTLPSLVQTCLSGKYKRTIKQKLVIKFDQFCTSYSRPKSPRPRSVSASVFLSTSRVQSSSNHSPRLAVLLIIEFHSTDGAARQIQFADRAGVSRGSPVKVRRGVRQDSEKRNESSGTRYRAKTRERQYIVNAYMIYTCICYIHEYTTLNHDGNFVGNRAGQSRKSGSISVQRIKNVKDDFRLRDSAMISDLFVLTP